MVGSSRSGSCGYGCGGDDVSTGGLVMVARFVAATVAVIVAVARGREMALASVVVMEIAME